MLYQSLVKDITPSPDDTKELFKTKLRNTIDRNSPPPVHLFVDVPMHSLTTNEGNVNDAIEVVATVKDCDVYFPLSYKDPSQRNFYCSNTFQLFISMTMPLI